MGTRLFIGNLSYQVTEQELREAFTGEGVEVRSVRIALDRETGRPRGFAFVEAETEDGAKAAIEKLAGRMLQGRPIAVQEAQARPPAGAPRPGGGPGGPRPGGFGGGGGPGGPRPGGFGGGGFGGPPRGPAGGGGGFGGPPRPGGFGGPRPGGFDARGGGGGPPGRFGADAQRKERVEKKKSTRPKPEEKERGNWRWNGKVDED